MSTLLAWFLSVVKQQRNDKHHNTQGWRLTRLETITSETFVRSMTAEDDVAVSSQ
jgi:hypothetical protein